MLKLQLVLLDRGEEAVVPVAVVAQVVPAVLLNVVLYVAQVVLFVRKVHLLDVVLLLTRLFVLLSPPINVLEVVHNVAN